MNQACFITQLFSAVFTVMSIVFVTHDNVAQEYDQLF